MDERKLKAMARATELMDILIDAGYCFENGGCGMSYIDLPSNIGWTTGATRIVVWDYDHLDYVLKFPCRPCDSPYCDKEVDVYSTAAAMGIGDYFGYCIKVGEYEGIPIYAMEYVECDEDGIEDASYKRSYELWCEQEDLDPNSVDTADKFNDVYWADEICYNSPYEWFLEQIGEVKRKVARFIDDNKIGDLHSANMGYVGQRLVLCDYAGYGWV